MSRWSIKWRVLTLAIVPAGLIATVLAVYFMVVRIDELELALRDRGRALARQLAPTAEYGLFTRNRELLQEIADTARTEADVSLVTISDSSGEPLAVSGDIRQRQVLSQRPESISLGVLDYPAVLYFSAPINQSVVRLVELDDPEASAGPGGGQIGRQEKLIGWVNVTMSKTATIERRNEMLLTGGVIAGCSLLLTALVALRMSTGITRPIRTIVGAVDKITNGDLNAHIDWQPGGELEPLARGINAMTMSLKTAQENLQEKINLATQQISYQATHDTLTGLINRREFEARLERALRSAQQHGNVHALCFMDLDQFKIVNDTCGHNAGDELLRQIAHQLRQKIRERDTLARIGGDEFTLLLENCHLDDAYKVASQLGETVHNFRFAWQDRFFSIGTSIGLVVINTLSESVASLLSQADAACYTAKDLGRNRVYVYNEDDEVRSSRVGAMEWVAEINRAFADNRFVLYCQLIKPLHEASELDPLHYEILLRMQGDKGETIMPMAFIPAAERYNQMQLIDRWVVRESLFMMRRLIDANPARRRNIFSINLSGPSLGDEKFAQFLTEQLAYFDIPPGDICFEITETAAITNLTLATNLMLQFRKLGCRFVLDDFGAGLSSFTYLKHLPVDGIKIDGAFVKGIAVNPIDFSMVQAINNIGHVMGLTTTAEFVEDAAIMRKLGEIRVDFGQGNGIQRPIPMEEWFTEMTEPRIGEEPRLKLVTAMSREA
jgi:diguanylate cyclase (GGDEF)-like protein